MSSTSSPSLNSCAHPVPLLSVLIASPGFDPASQTIPLFVNQSCEPPESVVPLPVSTNVAPKAVLAKVFATEAANFVCQRAVNLLGDDGMMDQGRAARAFRDVRVSRIYEGTSEIQRLVIGRDLARSAA